MRKQVITLVRLDQLWPREIHGPSPVPAACEASHHADEAVRPGYGIAIKADSALFLRFYFTNIIHVC